MEKLRRRELIDDEIRKIGKRGQMDVKVEKIENEEGVQNEIENNYLGGKEKIIIEKMRNMMREMGRDIKEEIKKEKKKNERIEEIIEVNF